MVEKHLLPGARYYEFSRNSLVVHRTESSFQLPLPEHIDFVSPTTRFPSTLRLTKSNNNKATSEGKLRTNPDSIRQMYNIPDTVATGNPANQQHVAGFLQNYFSPNDLELFYSQYFTKGKTLPNGKPTVKGPNEPGQGTVEGNLDVQYIMSIAANVSTTYWYTNGTRPYPGGGENEDFVQWLMALSSSTDTLPSVISVSYADEEFVIDPAFQHRVDVEFQKLGVQGAALFFGSGDDGVTGDHGVCPGNKFVAWWPASSPYVTAVGGMEEMASQAAAFSGGGFSNRYSVPAYQRSAVEGWSKSSRLPPASYYNHSGAGFPDVTAVAMGFWTYVGGIPDEVGGTSASTPTFAGMVSLLNDARMAQGKKALGPINQLIYQHPEAFTDVTRGTNTGGGGCGVGGYTAVEGWDPASGLGSPKFDALLKLALSLP